MTTRRKKNDQLNSQPASNQSHPPSAAATENLQEAPLASRNPGQEGGRPKYPNPFETKCSPAAKVRLLEHSATGQGDRYYFIIAFPDGVPPEKVRTFMKSEGVRWNYPEGTKSWNVIINYETRHQDRLHAERVFDRVVELMLQEKGIARPTEQAF